MSFFTQKKTSFTVSLHNCKLAVQYKGHVEKLICMMTPIIVKNVCIYVCISQDAPFWCITSLSNDKYLNNHIDSEFLATASHPGKWPKYIEQVRSNYLKLTYIYVKTAIQHKLTKPVRLKSMEYCGASLSSFPGLFTYKYKHIHIQKIIGYIISKKK